MVEAMNFIFHVMWIMVAIGAVYAIATNIVFISASALMMLGAAAGAVILVILYFRFKR